MRNYIAYLILALSFTGCVEKPEPVAKPDYFKLWCNCMEVRHAKATGTNEFLAETISMQINDMRNAHKIRVSREKDYQFLRSCIEAQGRECDSLYALYQNNKK